ncbi:MAG TPA: host attachment protein [Alphaproteobacteria bacterium]|nr:host attachment protein [Alphaproteobacteria bacterium]
MLTKKLTTWIIVCDGARARILVNRGSGTGLNVIESAEDDEARAKTQELGADRPGRTHDSFGEGRHAMAPRADWHKFAKESFAKDMAAIVNAGAVEDAFDKLVVIAPPRVLGNLRQVLNDQATTRLAGEIGKDLTQVPVQDLGPYLEDLVRL